MRERGGLSRETAREGDIYREMEEMVCVCVCEREREREENMNEPNDEMEE